MFPLENAAGTRLQVIVAHPDDETFGCGSLLLHARSARAATAVCCATRGEAGAVTDGVSVPPGGVGELREGELRAAAKLLGVERIDLLGLLDSGMDGDPGPGTLMAAEAAVVRRRILRAVDAFRPDVLVTLDGSDGHRDHARIRDLAIEVGAAREVPVYLHCLARSAMKRWADYMSAKHPDSAYLTLGELGTPDAQITHVVDTTAFWEQRWTAVRAHRSQISPFEGLPEDLARAFLCREHLAVVREAKPVAPTGTSRGGTSPHELPSGRHSSGIIPVPSGQPRQEATPTTQGSIELAYETFGRPSDPPVLLIMGLGAQLLSWQEDFCQELVKRHLFVVRFDNRDVGLSSHLSDAPAPDVAAIRAGDPTTAPYTLSDMAADTAGLIEGLGLGSAHVVGASLGGTIAQVLAVEHPARVRSLTSIMSSTNDPTVGQWTEEAFAELASQAEPTREATIARNLRVHRVTGSPAFPTSEAELRDRAGRAFDRDVDPEGATRQLAAFLASADRSAELATVTAPTLVIHGAADPVIHVSGGRATAAAIPDAELLVIEGMGHDLPRQLWPEFAARIAALVARAEQQRQGRQN